MTNFPLSTVIQSLLHDRPISPEDQEKVKLALQSQWREEGKEADRSLLLWVLCPNRRSMSGRSFVRELCDRWSG